MDNYVTIYYALLFCCIIVVQDICVTQNSIEMECNLIEQKQLHCEMKWTLYYTMPLFFAAAGLIFYTTITTVNLHIVRLYF